MIHSHAQDALQPVILCTFQLQNIKLLTDKINEWQELGPLEPVLVEVPRGPVGCCYNNDIALEQSLKQATQNHRIHDIRHLEFVETQEPRLIR